MEDLLRVYTYNMHGYNQGKYCLERLCRVADAILVQEHWLSSAGLDKLNVCDDFILYASSAVDNVLQRGVLYGRPFGVVAIL